MQHRLAAAVLSMTLAIAFTAAALAAEFPAPKEGSWVAQATSSSTPAR